MNVTTFQAPSMAEALALVKRRLGAGAVILHTREFTRWSWLRLRRRRVVEITAGVGTPVRSRSAASLSGGRAATPIRPAPRRLPGEAPPPGDVRNTTEAIINNPRITNAVMANLLKQMEELKGAVNNMSAKVHSGKAGNLPEALLPHYLALVQNAVAEEIAHGIIQRVRDQLQPDLHKQEAIVRDRMAREIQKLLPVSGPILRTKQSGPHVVALVGPTGVGKTTTIAKLAANLSLKQGQRVGLITIDTYRIAAIDQLNRYAEIIKVPLVVARNPEEMQEALARLADCDHVLIDTAGRSPSDNLKIGELRQFIQAAQPDEVHLVLSMTQTEACVDMAIKSFSQVRVDRIIFTKLDEAAHVGTVLNVACRINKALSYITTGQDVPNDIEEALRQRIAKLILGPQE